MITGTLVSGRIDDTAPLVLLPSGRDVKVRGLQVHGETATEVVAGQRTAVNLLGVDVADVSRGDVLCTPGAFEPTRRADVQLEMLAEAKPLRHGARGRFHHGTGEILGRVALSGETGLARIRFEAPAILTRGDRFILRAYSPPITIGGGTVLDPHPGRGAIRTPAGRARFARLATTAGVREAIAAFVDEKAGAGLPKHALMSRAGLSPGSADAVAAELRGGQVVTEIGELLVASAWLADRSAALVRMITHHHAAEPLSPGVPREQARERLFGRAAPAVFDHLVAALERSGTLVARDTLALAGHQRVLSPDEVRAQDALATSFRAAGLAPPDARTVVAATGLNAAVGERMLKLMVREKALVRLGDLVFHADALERLKRDVRAKKASGEARLDVALFKERYGISRKFAIPLLEYLDRERLTRRVGDARVIL